MALAAAASLFCSANVLTESVGAAKTVQQLAGISGRVIDASTRAPLAGARVVLARSNRSWKTITDQNGRFSIEDLLEGTYLLEASKPRFSDGAYGRLSPDEPAASFELARGERLADLDVQVWPLSSISGFVFDDSGDPLVGVMVKAMAVAAAPEVIGSALTDDRGAFRIESLQPNQCRVAVFSDVRTWPLSVLPFALDHGIRIGDTGSVATGDGFARQTGSQLAVHPTTFFPNAKRPSDAAVIDLRTGEDREGIDFHIAPEPALAVHGSLTSTEGDVSFAPMTLRLQGAPQSQEAARTVADVDGNFQFYGIVPGDYVLEVFKVRTDANSAATAADIALAFVINGHLTARPSHPKSPPSAAMLWGSADVMVREQDVTLQVRVGRAPRLRGRIDLRDEVASFSEPRFGSILIAAEPLQNGVTGILIPGRVDPSGSFETWGVPPGPYVVRALNVPPGWAVSSVISGGRPVTDTPVAVAGDMNLAVTLGRSASITGVVTNLYGSVPAYLYVFPVDRTMWIDTLQSRRCLALRASRLGAFALRDLPPGEYAVLAADRYLGQTWWQPSSLDKVIALATRLSLVAGDVKTVTIAEVKIR